MAEPTAAWMASMTLMKTSRVIVGYWIWLENLDVWALVFGGLIGLVRQKGLERISKTKAGG